MCHSHAVKYPEANGDWWGQHRELLEFKLTFVGQTGCEVIPGVSRRGKKRALADPFQGIRLGGTKSACRIVPH